MAEGSLVSTGVGGSVVPVEVVGAGGGVMEEVCSGGVVEDSVPAVDVAGC